MVENSPEGFDILTSSLKPGHVEVCGPKHRVFRVGSLWDSNDKDPTLWDLAKSYGYIFGWALLHLRQYDAVVAGGFIIVNGGLFILGRLLGVPVIGLGNAEEFTLTLRGKGFKDWVRRLWLRHTHRFASGFVVVCHFCSDILATVDVKPEMVDVVPSSINSDKLYPISPERLARYKVLSVGRLVERKGFHLLVDAVASLRAELPDIDLTIVGDGPYKETIEQRVRELGAEDYVSVLTGLDDLALSECYAQSNVFVLAHMMLDNGDTEGCPTVFSEASGCGLPVIGGTEGGASTVIIDGETGYIVDSRNRRELADRIGRILTNPQLATAMGRAGAAKVRREHTPEVTGEAFFESVRRFSYGFEGRDEGRTARMSGIES